MQGTAESSTAPPSSSSSSSTNGKPFALERDAAVRTVERVCRLIHQVQQSLVSDETVQKKDRSPVTVADFAAQAIVIRDLVSRFPDYPFIAEEDTKQLTKQPELRAKVLEHVRKVVPEMGEDELMESIGKGKCKPEEMKELGSKLWWTLDPIDGTLGFLRKEQYAVALALMKNNEPVLGILGCPALPHHPPPLSQTKTAETQATTTGCIFIAVKGQGAFVRHITTTDDGDEQQQQQQQPETPIRVSQVSEGSELTFTESVESSHSAHSTSERIAQLLGVKNPPIRMDSQCKYATVARGHADVYLRMTATNYAEKIWDHAAGVVVVKEAGGEVTDLEGRPLDFSRGQTLSENHGVVASNGILHAKVLAAVREVLDKKE